MPEVLSGLQQDDEDGLNDVEYALLLVLIAIVGVTAWTILGKAKPRVSDGSTSPNTTEEV